MPLQAGGSRLFERRWLRGRVLDPASVASLRGWLPVALDTQQVAWRHLPHRLSAPFFSDDLVRQPHEQRAVLYTPLHWLERLEPHIAPSALVFHASRCGSTLLSQLLATLPQCIVHSEPPVIDDFIARHDDAPVDAAVAGRLRQLFFALGQRRTPQETHFVVKLDCWHIRHLPLLRATLPDTPFWFLYREPEAIMASHRRQRGPQMVPGMVLPAQFGAALHPGDLEAFTARVLGHIYAGALAHANDLYLLDYRELPGVVWERLLDRLGIACDAGQLNALRARSRFHAKSGGSAYAGDAPTQATSAHLLEQLTPLYRQLEAMRARQS